MRWWCWLCLASCVAGGEVSYRVRLPEGRVVTLAAEEYVAAVTAGEAGTLVSAEARKAMAVAARTYAFRMQGRHRAEGFDFCTTTHCQRALVGKADESSTAAARATEGEMLWAEGQPVFAVYSQDCGGRSESASAIWPDMAAPYLRVHDDPYCLRSRPQEWVWRVDWHLLAEALQAEHLRVPQPLTGLEIAKRTQSNRAQILRLKTGSVPVLVTVLVNASSVRFAIGRRLGWNLVRSDRYEIDGNRIHGRGQGHGVGLCQMGADEMGKEGQDYRAILRFYFPGTSAPSRSATGFQWTQLGGERITVLTALPNRDRIVPVQAEQALGWAEQRVHRKLKRPVEIKVYPDLASFRNAAGAPGWVAGRFRHDRIALQPQANLMPTLRHELLHAIVEQNATPGLPLWFREGLVGALCGEAQAGNGVRDLMHRLGETRVLGWIETGLPADLSKSYIPERAAPPPEEDTPSRSGTPRSPVAH